MVLLSRCGGLDPIVACQFVSAMALHQAEKVRKGEQAFLRGRGAERVFEDVCGKPVRDRNGWGSRGHLQGPRDQHGLSGRGLALGR